MFKNKFLMKLRQNQIVTTEVKWNNLKTSNDSNLAYDKFLDTFTSLYSVCFPRLKIKVKVRNRLRTWITRGIAKSSKKKQRLYENV